MKKFFSLFYRTFSSRNLQNRRIYSITGICGISLFGYKQFYVHKARNAICATNLVKTEVVAKKGSREARFLEFASMECNGLILMTPADFLESVTQQQPRFLKSRLTISEKDAQNIIRNTPSKRYGSSKLFRSLDKEGLITYTEYLFLLCVLTKPQSGFKIAFNMFDTDLNQQVEKSEFLVMEHAMHAKRAAVVDKINAATDSSSIAESWFVLKLLNRLITRKLDPLESDDVKSEESIDSVQVPDPELNTTMLIHFFGKYGKEKLSFNDFSKFMENLQTEILEIEFTEFSKGLKTISETDFARILLRCTTVDKDSYDEYIRRVVHKLKVAEGITFEDFKNFFQFLNNLEDFILAMKMYTMVDRPISKSEFRQAVKACTNTSLSKQLVRTIFYMFDEDDDGHLSYQEFVQIMKNRLNRGFTTSSKSGNVLRKYRHCVSDHIYNNY